MIDCTPLLGNLLHPEASRGAVEQTKQGEMFVFGGITGNLMIGAERLNTFPPRSSTKWLCVATKAKTMESGVRSYA